MGLSIVDFAKSLNPGHCRIRNTPKLIFLCGGKTASSARIRSARDFFFRHLLKRRPDLASRVRLAETVNEWFDREVFPDLLELETYLADLAEITILFVESPGSIAELGAFAASDALRPKTLAVLNRYHDFRKSFIADGPIRKIEGEKKDLLRYYEWDPRRANSPKSRKEFKEMTNDLIRFLEGRDESRPEETLLDIRKHGHILLLIADLIRMAGVATATDITDYLVNLGRADIRPYLDRYLSLLVSLGSIERIPRSNQVFYVNASSTRLIRYAYISKTAIKDEKRLKAAIRSTFDSTRKQVLRRAIRRGLPRA